MNKVTVNDKLIGADRAYIIADVGSNHKQDLKLAKESIDAVVEAGADAVKFQSIKVDELYFRPDQKTREFVSRLAFPEKWHYELNDYCKQKGIVFFSSPTYMRSIDIMEEIDVPLYKLASAQIGTFPQLVEKVASLNKPTIFSTGIADYEEIIKAVRIFKKYQNDKFIILHCNSIYPTPANRVNLQLMDTYKSMFGNPVGFSDHTNGIQIALAAVTKGANVIEKHFTLDRNMDTPDSSTFACDPEELKKLVNEIREVELATARFADRLSIQEEEKEFKDAILYRLISKRQLSAGETLTESDLEFMRYPEGIDCRDFYSRKEPLVLNRDVVEGTLITEEMLLL